MAEGTVRGKKKLQKFIDEGLWEDMTWSEICDRNARDYPDKEAIVDANTRLTWSQVKQDIDRLALAFVDLGLNRDDVIVIHLPTCAEALLVRFACEKVGLIAVPVLRSFRESEIRHTLGLTEAKGIVILNKYRGFDYYNMTQSIRPDFPRLEHIFVIGDEVPEGCISIRDILQEPRENKFSTEELAKFFTKRRMPCTEVSFLAHTTGSTGFPKFAEWPAILSIARAKGGVKKWKFTKDSVVAALTPAHSGINNPVFNWGVLVGAKIVMLDRFDPAEALELIERERVTYFGAVPTMMTQMLNHPDFNKYNLSSLKSIQLAGALVPPSLAREAEEKTGAKVMALYGSRDIGSTASPTVEDPPEVRWFTVGKPNDWDQIMLVDDAGKEVPRGEVGEIKVKAVSGSSGYFRNPEASKAFEGDFVSTGDLGRIDENGNLSIVGRKKNIIIRGGQNIFPAEIESLLDAHPKVSKAAVVKMPDPLYGERACAYIALKPGETLSFDEMVSFLKEKKIASYKFPERLELVEQIPMVGDGTKVDIKGLEDDIIEKLKTEKKI
jgi:non-ribosomal peptide synthetase component E (peptide arylation enzyme)